jgi:predicted component of type VI protein secretion system
VADLLGHLLERTVTVVEAVGRWRPTPGDARTRIGKLGKHCELGFGATLGSRFFAVDWDVAFSVRATSMEDLERLLPGGDTHALLVEAAAAILPAHIDWQARIEIDERKIEPARLGKSRLGMTGWIAPRRRDTIRADVRLAGKTRTSLAA